LRKMRWVGNVARVEKMNTNTILVKPQGKRSLRRPRRRWEDGRILGKLVWKLWTSFIGSEEGPVAGSCEHGNEASGSVKGGEFLD